MSDITLRYYNSTLAYIPSLADRKLRDTGKRLRTRLSRRRFRQGIAQTLHRLRLS